MGDSPNPVRIYGLDISPEATKITKNNFSKINAQDVKLFEADAIDWLKDTSEKIDLLYIDIVTMQDGKSEYLDVLDAAYPMMNEGSLVIAHDINEEKFKKDLIPFVEKVLNHTKFKSIINLNFDSYGLSISIKR
ncbi:class I SAM-dependent methyltransferase [Sporosarcina sp. resist]|uniref:O-methyltransferase n=1 Tax=Sporosarcina sp. resist TaxID=2762563 RepID=UPI00164E05C2|nr:class I SAM-dependent methyltransferase [Sporosarcina sp. resist]QNK89105.1 class I SAM-dependent methyltransferase [Sporosarcina sp. resist]